MDTGLLIIRAVTGLLLAAHGCQKTLGWFGGNGLDRTAAWFESMNFRPGRVMALVAGTSEIGAGLLLALGLLTPLAAAGVCGTLAVAIYTHRAAGLWSSKGGCELAVMYATGALGIGLTGAGKYSLDHAWSIPHTHNSTVAAAAIAASLLFSGAIIVRSRLTPPVQATP